MREVDAKFSRLHGVPAGRALDLYGRVIGGPTTPSPAAAPAARKQNSRTRGHASTLKCARPHVTRGCFATDVALVGNTPSADSMPNTLCGIHLLWDGGKILNALLDARQYLLDTQQLPVVIVGCCRCDAVSTLALLNCVLQSNPPICEEISHVFL